MINRERDRKTCHSNKILAGTVSQISPQKNVRYVCVCVCLFGCVVGEGGGGGVDNTKVWYKVFASTDRKLIT